MYSDTHTRVQKEINQDYIVFIWRVFLAGMKNHEFTSYEHVKESTNTVEPAYTVLMFLERALAEIYLDGQAHIEKILTVL